MHHIYCVMLIARVQPTLGQIRAHQRWRIKLYFLAPYVVSFFIYINVIEWSLLYWQNSFQNDLFFKNCFLWCLAHRGKIAYIGISSHPAQAGTIWKLLLFENFTQAASQFKSCIVELVHNSSPLWSSGEHGKLAMYNLLQRDAKRERKYYYPIGTVCTKLNLYMHKLMEIFMPEWNLVGLRCTQKWLHRSTITPCSLFFFFGCCNKQQ